MHFRWCGAGDNKIWLLLSGERLSSLKAIFQNIKSYHTLPQEMLCFTPGCLFHGAFVHDFWLSKGLFLAKHLVLLNINGNAAAA